MNELSRSLLSAAREGLAPPPDVAARVRAKVAASVGAPVAGAVAAKSLTAAKSTGAAKSIAVTSGAAKSFAGSSALKLGALALIVGVVAVGVAHRSAKNDAPQLSISTTHDELAQPVTTRASHDDAPIATTSPDTRANGTALPSREAAPASLSREVELIDQAMSALRRHEPNAALAAMHTFDRETLGHAQMAEEAAAITIEAHCGLGDDVSDRLAAFDRTWPSSAERSRITDACH